MAILVTIGAVMVALTVALHAIGTTAWVRYLSARYADEEGSWRRRDLFGVLSSTAVVMLLLHVIEVELWALAFWKLLPEGELASLEEASYFSFVTFTSLGYGDVTLSSQWRLLSGIEALNGILLAGFSTALLFAVLQRAWGTNK